MSIFCLTRETGDTTLRLGEVGMRGIFPFESIFVAHGEGEDKGKLAVLLFYATYRYSHKHLPVLQMIWRKLVGEMGKERTADCLAKIS